eukprot:8842388-Pyramimonas_sp.AAC.1
MAGDRLSGLYCASAAASYSYRPGVLCCPMGWCSMTASLSHFSPWCSMGGALRLLPHEASVSAISRPRPLALGLVIYGWGSMAP